MSGTDGNNPGRKQVQQFTVSSGLDGNRADVQSAPGGFLKLLNCIVDKRIGAVLKRPGSADENLATTSLGVPLGMGEHISASSGSMPVNRVLLTNFAGSVFKINRAGAYSNATVTARCSFSTSRQTQFAQIGSYLYIAGGLPAKFNNSTDTIDRIGIIPPATTPLQFVLATAGNITLTSGAQYMCTFYNSSTGLESDWSNLSTNTGACASKQILVTLPTDVAQNWDKVRLYRTLDGGSFPYLVAEVNAGTSTYTDNTSDANLTTRAYDRYDNAVPPQASYVIAAYSQCLWLVDASNPYKLRFSKPYTGSDTDLEYFPVDNYVISSEPITGLFVVPGKLLVFHPRSVSYISGGSVDDFVFQPFIPGVGTVFPNSIATNGSDIVFLAEQGFVSIPGQGGAPSHLSREIDYDLQPLLNGSYNSMFYASSAWNPALRQFIFMISAQSTSTAPWEEVGTGYTADPYGTWQTPALVTDTWEDVSGASVTDQMRVKVWGWSPELSSQGRNLWMEYDFPNIYDNNILAAYPTFLFHPRPSSDTCDPQQDKTMMGYYMFLVGGQLKACFRRDKNVDSVYNESDSMIDAYLITGRLVPGLQEGGQKLFTGISFPNSYNDPTSDGSTTSVKYLLDFDDAHLRSYTGSLKNFVSPGVTGDIFKTTDMQGKYMHLYISDVDSQSQSKILLSEFFVHYRERLKYSGR